MIALTSLLQGIQAILLVGSTLLIIGVLYGIHTQTQDFGLDISARGSDPGKHPGPENRRERRIECNLFVEIMDGQDHVARIGRLLNLSIAGARIASTSGLRRGEPILARLPTLRNGANRISGRVIWVRAMSGTTHYGIQLNHTTPTN